MVPHTSALLRDNRGIGFAIAGAAVAAAAAFIAVKSRRSERANPAQGKFVNVMGVDLHYIEVGKGPPVVILHGNGSMIEEMSASGLVEELARQHRVIVFDRPGYGHSSRPRTTLWTPERQAELFLEAFEELGLEEPLVVAHSWGTLVALAAAIQNPSALRGIVLMSGYYFPTARFDALMLAVPAIPLLGDIIRHTISPLLGRLAWHRMVGRMFAPRKITARFERAFSKWMALRPSQIRASAAEAGMMVPAAAGLRGRYGEISIPVAIIAGAEDRLVDTSHQSERLAAEMPHAKLRIVPGLGHMVHHFAAPEIAAVVEGMDPGTRQQTRRLRTAGRA